MCVVRNNSAKGKKLMKQVIEERILRAISLAGFSESFYDYDGVSGREGEAHGLKRSEPSGSGSDKEVTGTIRF